MFSSPFEGATATPMGVGMRKFWRPRKAAESLASLERQRSERRLDDTKKLLAQIERIKTENHFADSIIAGLLDDGQ